MASSLCEYLTSDVFVHEDFRLGQRPEFLCLKSFIHAQLRKTSTSPKSSCFQRQCILCQFIDFRFRCLLSQSVLLAFILCLHDEFSSMGHQLFECQDASKDTAPAAVKLSAHVCASTLMDNFPSVALTVTVSNIQMAVSGVSIHSH